LRPDPEKCDQSARADVIRVMPDAHPSDDSCTAEVKPANQGADEAQRFTALYREHHALVRDFARRRLGTDQAQEIVAETFLVAWRRFDDVPPSPLPWLYRIALYEIANLRRRHTSALRLRHALIDNQITRHIDSEPYEQSDLGQAVAAAFGTLKPRDQEILRLAAWEQLSTVEGAEVLQCSVSAYRMRLHRARSRLAARSGAREHMEPQPRRASEPPRALSRGVTLGRRPFETTEAVL
jgi:RNA polymerase sigma factor (sigma-70 family)